ncbi:carboxypeptidase-like regulatory domain-containing protein [Flavobacterium sp. GT3R68]|uniref:carboxypeptidase-like regulatory domain-containing protein n=1 Tax=Flavobacterium sp. GT3R68 TaxID=2594437 RepID=UPI000F87CF05|nr:carboxypeptidase-like regulatory domain-containing protein [Flavobacterium sp. GT3R68]RTY95904.1 carboxypeptidase-like regulatory domain-containing protein [Flavobacterium sp. GSN2]TRW93676.1 carboxypeptidase-like regulatory domain-containing protein [Flavobacterium sp. GT3R68]
MLNKIFSILIFLITLTFSAQTKGVVLDSISGKPIPYVNIWVENENIGTTSEETGEFSIGSTEKNKNLIFSVLGFEKKIIKVSEARQVKLKPIAYQLDEVVLSRRKNTKQIEIGKVKGGYLEAFENGPRIDVKFFPYYTKYKKTKYIKKVTISAESQIENTTVKIHFYNVDTNGFPGEELLKNDLIVKLKKGVFTNRFDVTEFDLKIPKNGIFVGLEKLIIEKNKIEKIITDPYTKKVTIYKTYSPLVLYNYVERDVLYTFSGGKWKQQINVNTLDSSDKKKVYEPAINLILTN